MFSPSRLSRQVNICLFIFSTSLSLVNIKITTKSEAWVKRTQDNNWPFNSLSNKKAKIKRFWPENTLQCVCLGVLSSWKADCSDKSNRRQIGQCHRYLYVLHDAASQGLRDHPEIVAYHPRATIVIGRSHDWNNEKTRALHGLNQRLRSIKIMTYDHLFAQSEAILSLLQPNTSEEQLLQSSIDNFDLDNEIPF